MGDVGRRSPEIDVPGIRGGIVISIKKQRQSIERELIQHILVGVEPGIDSAVAREVSRRMRQYACKLTIECNSQAIADARVLFDLLILGVRTGERVTLRCTGPDAHAAIEDVARVLRGGAE